eukprot:10958528-Ditylum_brightwellii.AAC.1
MMFREVGKEWYTKYKRYLFKTYHTAENKEFLVAISQERRNWIMNKQKEAYCYLDVMSFALKMFNKQKSLREWMTKNVPAKKKTEDDA